MTESRVSYSANTERLESSIRTNQRQLLFYLLLPLLFTILYNIWQDSNLSIVKAVDVDNVYIISKDALCPGEKLVFGYQLHARGEGLLIRDLTVWKIDPPRTVIYSMERRFILDAAIDQKLVESWRIPDLYLDHETGEEQPLVPGAYRRYIAISSPSKDTVIDIEHVDFTIREDCHA